MNRGVAAPQAGWWSPEALGAYGVVFTAVIALAAGVIALSQLGEARRLRKERAQPYVVVYMVINEAAQQLVDLVVRNLGATAATDVRIEVTPPLMRSGDGAGAEPEEVWLPDAIPTLAPNQEWRGWWDSAPTRAATDLPDRYDVVVRYRDSHGDESYTSRAVLDWGAYKRLRYVRVYTTHDAAEALRKIERTLPKWQESIHGGLQVYVRDGDAKDRDERDRYQQRRREQQEHEHTPGGEQT